MPPEIVRLIAPLAFPDGGANKGLQSGVNEFMVIDNCGGSVIVISNDLFLCKKPPVPAELTITRYTSPGALAGIPNASAPG